MSWNLALGSVESSVPHFQNSPNIHSFNYLLWDECKGVYWWYKQFWKLTSKFSKLLVASVNLCLWNIYQMDESRQTSMVFSVCIFIWWWGQNVTPLAISARLLGGANETETLVQQHVSLRGHLPVTSIEGALWSSNFSIFRDCQFSPWILVVANK